MCGTPRCAAPVSRPCPPLPTPPLPRSLQAGQAKGNQQGPAAWRRCLVHCTQLRKEPGAAGGACKVGSHARVTHRACSEQQARRFSLQVLATTPVACPRKQTAPARFAHHTAPAACWLAVKPTEGCDAACSTHPPHPPAAAARAGTDARSPRTPRPAPSQIPSPHRAPGAGCKGAAGAGPAQERRARQAERRGAQTIVAVARRGERRRRQATLLHAFHSSSLASPPMGSPLTSWPPPGCPPCSSSPPASASRSHSWRPAAPCPPPCQSSAAGRGVQGSRQFGQWRAHPAAAGSSSPVQPSCLLARDLGCRALAASRHRQPARIWAGGATSGAQLPRQLSPAVSGWSHIGGPRGLHQVQLRPLLAVRGQQRRYAVGAVSAGGREGGRGGGEGGVGLGGVCGWVTVSGRCIGAGPSRDSRHAGVAGRVGKRRWCEHHQLKPL